ILAVLAEPVERAADAELDAPDGIDLVADGLLLALAQLVVRRLEQLGEQLLLRREVPVEDALADPERGHDVGHRRGVVAALGEEPCCALDQLIPPFLASGRQLAAHEMRRLSGLLTARSTIRPGRACVTCPSISVRAPVVCAAPAR